MLKAGRYSSRSSVTVVLVLALLTPIRSAGASDQVENTGDVLRLLIPAVAYGGTFYLHDSEGRKQFYKSFFTNLGVTYALKASISKTRPNGEDNDSFPPTWGHPMSPGAGWNLIIISQWMSWPGQPSESLSASSGRIASTFHSGELDEVPNVISCRFLAYGLHSRSRRGCRGDCSSRHGTGKSAGGEGSPVGKST